jgi:MoaA/NifB/PqqE/SkfB family radical SAM enzyme
MELLSSLDLTWVHWLCIYSAPGILYGTYHLIKEYRNRPSQFARDMLRAIGQEKSLVDRLLNIFVYVIAFVSVGFGWPLFGIWAISQSKQEAARELERNKPNFNCAPEFLIAKIDPCDAEIKSYVIDPLGTVPPLPFGHLNKAWGNFLANMIDPADELWSFHIPKGGQCGKHRFATTGDIRGFAKVRDGEILGEFITESD